MLPWQLCVVILLVGLLLLIIEMLGEGRVIQQFGMPMRSLAKLVKGDSTPLARSEVERYARYLSAVKTIQSLYIFAVMGASICLTLVSLSYRGVRLILDGHMASRGSMYIALALALTVCAYLPEILNGEPLKRIVPKSAARLAELIEPRWWVYLISLYLMVYSSLDKVLGHPLVGLGGMDATIAYQSVVTVIAADRLLRVTPSGHAVSSKFRETMGTLVHHKEAETQRVLELAQSMERVALYALESLSSRAVGRRRSLSSRAVGRGVEVAREDHPSKEAEAQQMLKLVGGLERVLLYAVRRLRRGKATFPPTEAKMRRILELSEHIGLPLYEVRRLKGTKAARRYLASEETVDPWVPNPPTHKKRADFRSPECLQIGDKGPTEAEMQRVLELAEDMERVARWRLRRARFAREDRPSKEAEAQRILQLAQGMNQAAWYELWRLREARAEGKEFTSTPPEN